MDLTRYIDTADGTEWHVDQTFLASTWTCLWGNGCEGMLDEPSAELAQGCCSAGAQLIDDDEAMLIAALAAALDPDHFEQHQAAESGGVFSDPGRAATRVIDGACIFHNRPGFRGGAGCALHLDAVANGDDPIDAKPAICWQLPFKVETNDDGSRTLRRWERDDWGPGGASMAWCCTEQEHADRVLPSAYVGEQPVAMTLRSELRGLVGDDVAGQILRQVT